MWFLKKLFSREEAPTPTPATVPKEEEARQPGVVRRISRKVVPGLPRPGTFRRQQSERREKLEEVKPLPEERRAVSEERQKNPLRASTTAVKDPRQSAPEILETAEPEEVLQAALGEAQAPASRSGDDGDQGFVEVSNAATNSETQSTATDEYDEVIAQELERKWILNLSMHFRDKSRREKFFVTYAETPTHWRRVTISLDYRNSPPHSLEEELQGTKFQRDKSARIYEAIRDSLRDIQFYDTVTNLKLQTENDRLHVHVVEDLSEIISFPPVKSINHLKCRRVREGQLEFDSHLSGFVYKVKLDGQVFIKKEIPGPDTVDEFLYEINALHRLSGSRSVIQFGGVVVDNHGEKVKGLLISYAEQGALIDVIYDGEGKIPWRRRERWAKQIVQGLSEIHEAGFVQGDFTLSNIVIDEHDNAKIIDINRRGCPVGWEPPEVVDLIESNQRISMYIGVKSDLYQLGMVLYALAFQEDEPENHRPFRLGEAPPDVPDYFLDICRSCLQDNPRYRSQASVLHTCFPEIDEYDYPSELRTPIIIDAPYIEESARANGYYTPSSTNDHLPSHHQDVSEPIYGTYSYTSPPPFDDSYDYPPRGRSRTRSGSRPVVDPASVPLPDYSIGSRSRTRSGSRPVVDPASIPLPDCSIGSRSLESLRREERVESEPQESPANFVLQADRYASVREDDPIDRPYFETEMAPRFTAAAISPSQIYWKDLHDLAGVGGVHSSDLALPLIPPMNDDDFTTDTHSNNDPTPTTTVLESSVGG